MLGSGIDVTSDRSLAVRVCLRAENACNTASTRRAPSAPDAGVAGPRSPVPPEEVPPDALTAESVATQLFLSSFRM